MSMTGYSLGDYQQDARHSEHLPEQTNKLDYLLLGLSGETGSLIAEVKKRLRDEPRGYRPAVSEELGDALWYLSTLCSSLDIRLADLAEADSSSFRTAVPTAIRGDVIRDCHDLSDVTGQIVRLGSQVDSLTARPLLKSLLQVLLRVAASTQVDPDQAARENIKKAAERWPIERSHTPLFDADDDSDEQLPRRLELEIVEKKSARSQKPYVLTRYHEIHIGDRLTDNIEDADGYRFHDVFHMAYASVLGWSPVLRALLRCKRKGNGNKDEEQDGARAIIIEEGISAWLFAHARTRNFYKELDSLDYSILKLVRILAAGFEVEACPYWEWEEAILQGFRAFRYLMEHRSGRVVMDLSARRFTVGPITG